MNLLSIALDDLNAYATLKSIYGDILKTPNLDRLAAESVVFQNAYSQIALCNPSRTSILSGLDPAITGVFANDRDWKGSIDAAATLPAVLKDAGFDTSLYGKIFHGTLNGYADVVAHRDFSDKSYWFNDENKQIIGTTPVPETAHGDYINTTKAIELLESYGPDDDFALFLGIFKPHGHWYVAQEYFDLYSLDDIVAPWGTIDEADIPEGVIRVTWDGDTQLFNARDWAETVRGYFAAVSFADAMVGRVLTALEDTGQDATTSVVLWSDHGYHLGDRDRWHKFTLWEEAARAPLMFKVPGVAAGEVTQPVELLDIFPTVTELMGVTPPETLSGRSLTAFLDDPSLTDGSVAITTMYGAAALRTEQYRFIRNEDDSRELYDMVADPHQQLNLAEAPAYAAVRSELEARLIAEMADRNFYFVEEQDTGTDENEVFVIGDYTGTVTGGKGSDSYIVKGIADPDIVELPGGGRDFLYVGRDTVVPENIEVVIVRARSGEFLRIDGNEFSNRVIGGNTIYGYAGQDTLSGNFEIYGGPGGDLLIGRGSRQRGFDHILYGDGGNDTINAKAGDDRAYGGNGNDRLNGGKGNDTLDGGNGRDRINGSLGQDLLFGRDGHDLMYGGSGSDVLIGGNDNDRLQGGFSGDMHRPGYGDYFVDGGRGMAIDWVSYLFDITDGEGVNVELGDGTAEHRGGLFTDALRRIGAVEGTRVTDRIRGSDEGDILVGQAGDDRLFGKDGDDTVFGGTGNDEVVGGPGDDLLHPGLGDDIVKGGFGTDTLSYEDIENLADGVEIDVVAGTVTARDGRFTDRFEAIQAFVGSLLADRILGSDAADDLSGAADADTILAAAGDDMLFGGEGDDLIRGGADDDFVRGEDGNDTLYGGNGEDQIQGDEGDDIVDGGDKNDRVAGGAGDDTVMGGDHDDVTWGGLGEDLVQGGLGNDIVNGGEGDDTINGEAGDDILRPGSGSDSIIGGFGNDLLSYSNDPTILHGVAADMELAEVRDRHGDFIDTFRGIEEIEGSRFDDVLQGTAGDDMLRGSGGHDRIEGRDGNDTIAGDDGSDSLVGGPGDDVILGGLGNDMIVGGIGFDTVDYSSLQGQAAGIVVDLVAGTTDKQGTVLSDTLTGIEAVTGTYLADRIIGDAADNLLLGGGGHDEIFGRWGNDDIRGERGFDNLFGGEGDDRIDGGEGLDTLSGGIGADVLFGGDGQDHLKGDDGDDVLDGGAADDILEGGAGNDYFLPGLGSDSIAGQGAPWRDTISYENIVYAEGLQFNVAAGTIVTRDGAHTDSFSGVTAFVGSAQGDVFYGGSGTDRFSGEGGDDVIVGGAGNDVLWGGDGSDIFVFRARDRSDTVVDFTPGVDKIDLSGRTGLRSFDDVVALHQTGGNGDVVITHPDIGNGSILLVGLTIDDLGAEDFIF